MALKKQNIINHLLLSDVQLKITRPNSVVVKYEDESKKVYKVKFSDWKSRVFQHEYDHMEGIDFNQRTK